MSKIWKLFICENIKTWKKLSTKILIIVILIALIGSLAIVKIAEKYSEEEAEILKLVEDNDADGNPILDANGNPVKVLKKVKVEITTETSLYNSIFEIIVANRRYNSDF